MDLDKVLEILQQNAQPEKVKRMAYFGINPEKSLGISVATLRSIARKIGRDHDLALKLWQTGIRDARILAPHIDEVDKVTPVQMDSWASDFDSWDVCDNCCGHLFDKTQYAYQKVEEWSEHNQEFVKRAAFSLIAWLAVHDKKQPDETFIAHLTLIKKAADDKRNYVKKAVNWALRSIGKRNIFLNEKALALAKNLKKMSSSSARWIGSDAFRELSSKTVQQRLKKKKKGV